jgi:hypothetical protein
MILFIINIIRIIRKASKSGKGYYVFHPDSLKENRQVPPVFLVDFNVRGEKIMLDSSITLKKHLALRHDQNFFSVDFAALNYTEPESNQYAYRLFGFQFRRT